MPQTIETATSLPRARPAEIPYALVTPWYAKRRNFYLIVLLLLLNVVATTSISWGPWVVNDIRAKLDARRAARAKVAADAQQATLDAAAFQRRQSAYQFLSGYQSPDGRIVYSEDLLEVPILIANGGYSIVQVSGTPQVPLPPFPVLADGPADLVAALDQLHPSRDRGVLFAHARATPTSHKARLIRATVEAAAAVETEHNGSGYEYTTESRRTVRFDVFDAVPLRTDVGPLWGLELNVRQPPESRVKAVTREGDGPADSARPRAQTSGDALRFLAGRPDPANASRWFLDYTLEGVRGTITASLRDDDRISLEFPRGTAAISSYDARGAEAVWNPHASTSPVPATVP